MANYCDTSYVVEGSKEDLDNLYNTMYKLQNMEKPLVENGFGTTWLGCLITELGDNRENYYCKGEWGGLERQGDIIRFSTESAWQPPFDTIGLLQEKFPSLSFYFIAEEPGCEVFLKNDKRYSLIKSRSHDLLFSLGNTGRYQDSTLLAHRQTFACLFLYLLVCHSP